MRSRAREVAVVGGGDSGLLTALALERLNPELDVFVIDDFEQDIPEVGKSTYIKIMPILHSFLGLREDRFIEEVRPVWKASVYFKDWCGHDPFHFPFDNALTFPEEDDPYNIPELGKRYYQYYHELSGNVEYLTKGEQIVEQRRSPFYYDPSKGGLQKYGAVAYHLNTERFNEYLRDVCRRRGISLIDDRISNVAVRDGEIHRLAGHADEYQADLYVDATGFARRLKGEFPGDFRGFELPLDAALNTQLERSIQDIVPATVIETGDSGWFWRIDTFDNRDIGYVYSSEFSTTEEAVDEFIERFDGRPDRTEITRLSFDSGYFPAAWEGNCIAIGNAEGFVEPLQSTGLTVNAWAAQILSQVLTSTDCHVGSGLRDAYNAWVQHMWESVYDFISVHYAFTRGGSEFWERARSIDLSKRVECFIEEFDRRGFAEKIHPTRNDSALNPPLVFEPIHFYTIMNRLGVKSSLYEDNEFHIGEAARRRENERFRSFREDVQTYLTVEEVYGLIDS